MPIVETPPPPGAIQAFQEGISWLAETEARFRDLHQAEWFLGPIPPPHIVEVWGLDGAILDRENFRRTWRFFVSGEDIPLGVIEVTPTAEWAGPTEYEFLAFHEGPSILATARAFARAKEFSSQQGEMGLTFLQLPALGAMFLWLQDLESPRRHLRWTNRDWLLAIPPAARGFPADEPAPMPRAVELLKSEVDRVANTDFVRSLNEESRIFGGAPQVVAQELEPLLETYEVFEEEHQLFEKEHEAPPSIEH